MHHCTKYIYKSIIHTELVPIFYYRDKTWVQFYTFHLLLRECTVKQNELLGLS